MPTIQQLDYKHFLANTLYPWCWACGRGEYDPPPGWFAPWHIERAHIFRGWARVDDVKAIVLLCSLCHKTSHREQVILDGMENPLPRLWPEHLLDLKRRFDPENYDREWLKTRCLGKLPHCVKLPALYLAEYRKRRG